MKRQFTVMAEQQSEVLQFSLDNLKKLQKYFPSNYLELLSNSFDKLMGSWVLKLKAVQKSRNYKKKFCKKKKMETR